MNLSRIFLVTTVPVSTVYFVKKNVSLTNEVDGIVGFS